MMITRIEIEGYRLLDGFAADLKPLSVVIGANAVGKSTLIDCLQLIAQCAEFPVNTAIGWHWGPASLLTAGNEDGKLTWRITVQKPAAAFWNQVPLEEGKPLVYEAALQADPQGQVRPQYEVLRKPEPAPGYTEAFKFLEATPYRRTILDRSHNLIPFDEAQPSPGVVRESDSPEVVRAGNGLPQPTQQEVALLLS